jgi:hypothetical protein
VEIPLRGLLLSTSATESFLKPDCWAPERLANSVPYFGFRSALTQLPQALHNRVQGRVPRAVEIYLGTAVHPPNCSVSLLTSLFKSLSFLRASSIFSTECKTVVWCLPPNCRPISGSEASVRCLAKYIAICLG